MTARAGGELVSWAEVRDVELVVVRRMREHMAGAHPSVFQGAGFEFAGLRDWQPGDRPAAVDWPQSTRLARARRPTRPNPTPADTLLPRDRAARTARRRRTTSTTAAPGGRSTAGRVTAAGNRVARVASPTGFKPVSQP